MGRHNPKNLTDKREDDYVARALKYTPGGVKAQVTPNAMCTHLLVLVFDKRGSEIARYIVGRRGRLELWPKERNK